MHFFNSVFLTAAALSSVDSQTRGLRPVQEPLDRPSAAHTDAPTLACLATSGGER